MVSKKIPLQESKEGNGTKCLTQNKQKISCTEKVAAEGGGAFQADMVTVCFVYNFLSAGLLCSCFAGRDDPKENCPKGFFRFSLEAPHGNGQFWG